jgi:cytoskeleton protein RodZ
MDRADRQHQHPAPDEVGRLLADTRQALGLTVGDVAAQLRLSRRQIEALEADDYERLPGKTFTRGFVRNYARLLQLDAEPLLASLDQALPSSGGGEILPKTEDIPFSSGRDDGRRRYLLLLALLLLVIPLVLYETYRDRGVAEAPLRSPVAVPVSPPAAEPAPAASAPPAETAAPAQPPAPTEPAPTAEAAPPAQPEPPAAQPVAAPAVGEALLRFRFEQESWVEVSDAKGQPVARQLNRAGSEWTLRARLPLSLVVGNAEGVTLELNGEPVALSARPGSGVARLTLP